MINKMIKLGGIIVAGAMFFAISPAIASAQYYYNNNGYYTPINVTTTNATNITTTSATISGLVNGANLYNTYNVETWFEYGTSPSFGYSTVHNNSNSGYANFNANIAGLNSNTVYYFRAIGQNPQGVVYGSTNSFRTNFVNPTNTYIDSNDIFIQNDIPLNLSVITNPATAVGSRSAKMNSLMTNTPNNPAMTWFEWGPTPSLGFITPTISLGSLGKAKHINTITGLAPATTYYFRAVIQNSSSKINGATLGFTTANVVIQNPVVEDNTETVINVGTVEPIETTPKVDLGANVVEANSFFPTSILGWLLLVILLLILILLSKHLYGNLTQRKIEPKIEHSVAEHI